MLVIVALVLGIAAGLVTGGRIDNFANLRVRWPWFVVAALVIREAAVATPLSQVEGVQYVYAASLAALIGWTLWHVTRLPGVWLVSTGAALNLIVILVNGSRMPVAPALAPALARHGHLGQYTVIGPGTNLSWLGDWIAFGRLPGVYSPGDLVSLVGIAVICFVAMRTHAEPGETARRIVSDPP
jgi:hypothetical protein